MKVLRNRHEKVHWRVLCERVLVEDDVLSLNEQLRAAEFTFHVEQTEVIRITNLEDK